MDTATGLQGRFYELMDKYNSGTEPLSSWETRDLVRLVQIADAELQNRTPGDKPAPVWEDDADYVPGPMDGDYEEA